MACSPCGAVIKPLRRHHLSIYDNITCTDEASVASRGRTIAPPDCAPDGAPETLRSLMYNPLEIAPLGGAEAKGSLESRRY